MIKYTIMIEKEYDSKNNYCYTNCSCWICDEETGAIKRRTSISGCVETIKEVEIIARMCGIDIDFN